METTITDRLNEVLKALMSVGGIKTAVIGSRDGLTVATLVEDQRKREYIDEVVALSSTMYGAAETVTMRLGLKMPTKVLADTDSGHLIVIGAGSKALLIVMTNPESAIGLSQAEMKKAAENIKEILGYN
jgi:predicted regulator of Ras-like GTPase activity (Roadblock/LC7/MglB family)